MKERLPGLVAIILLGILVAGTWWASDYAIRSVQIDPPRRITHERDSWSEKFIMLRTNQEGFAINRLEGQSMDHFPDTNSYEITSPKAVGHQAGSPITIGQADNGILYDDDDRIVLNGHAIIKRLADQDNQLLQIESKQLILEPGKDVVYTDELAKIINGNSTLRGDGMFYDNNSRQLTVKSASDVKISAQDQK